MNCLIFQVLRLDGNSLARIPTEALVGPSSLQDLHLQDNKIGQLYICDGLHLDQLEVLSAKKREIDLHKHRYLQTKIEEL